MAHDCVRACEMSLAVQEKADGGPGAEFKVAPLRVAEVPLTERGGGGWTNAGKEAKNANTTELNVR